MRNKKINHQRISVLAHPRSGTGYASKLALQYGKRVGHERLWRDGVASWMWVPKAKEVPWGVGYRDIDQFSIYLIRHPLETITSVYYTESSSAAWRREQLNSKLPLNGVAGALESVYGWGKLADSKYGYRIPRVRLDELNDFYSYYWNVSKQQDIEPQNARPHDYLSARSVEWLQEQPEYIKLLKEWKSAKNTAHEISLLPHYAKKINHSSWINRETLSRLADKGNFSWEDSDVLDLGCGSGSAGVLRKFGVNSLAGVDYSFERAEHAKKCGYDSVICDTIQNFLSQNTKLYDYIILAEVLEHVEQPREILESARRFGCVVGSVPLNHPYRAHLQVFKNCADVEKRLGCKVLWSDEKRAWFIK